MHDVIKVAGPMDPRVTLEKFRGSLAYDALTRFPLIAWFALCGWMMGGGLLAEMSAASALEPALMLTLAAKLSAIVFVLLVVLALTLRRPAVARASGLFPRIAAVGGTFSITGLALFQPVPQSLPVTVASLLFMCAGYVLACYSIMHLGRSLSMMAEARKLVMSGPYGVVRHPLYAAEAIASFGLLLQYLSLPAISLWVAHIGLQMCRMRYEEQILRENFQEYGDYALRVPRLLPGLHG